MVDGDTNDVTSTDDVVLDVDSTPTKVVPMNSPVNSSWRKDVYTVREAAPVLHVSTATVYRMIAAGILKPSDTLAGTGNRGYVIPRSEIEHYIASLKKSARRFTNAS